MKILHLEGLGDDKVCHRDRNPLQPRWQLPPGGGGAPRLQARPRLRADPQGESGAGGDDGEGVGDEEEARGAQPPSGCYELRVQYVILAQSVLTSECGNYWILKVWVRPYDSPSNFFIM